MEDRAKLLLSHVWREHEGLHVKSVEEELDTVGLYYIVGIYNYLALDQTQLFERKEYHEFVNCVPANDVVVIYLLKL